MTESLKKSGAIVVSMIAAALLWTGPAQAATGDYHPMRFEHITLDDGLSQSNVLSVLQDSKGWLWIGTENGLNRYDGYEFTNFKRDRGNPDGLPNDFIFDIEEDRDGNLWLATNGGGLVTFDRRTGKFRTYRHDADDGSSIASNIVRRLLIDEDGTIWVAMRGAGLDRMNPKTGEFIHVRLDNASDAASKNVYALHRDSRGHLWAGGDHGLSRVNIDTGEFVTFKHNPSDRRSLSDGSVRAIAEDSDGRIWVGTYGGGLNRMNSDGRSFQRFSHRSGNQHSLSGNNVTTIFEDSDARLWVGTTDGLNLYDRPSASFVRYAHDAKDPSSLGDNNVTTIFEDRTGLLWVGTKMRGLNKWNPRTWAYGLEPAKKLTASGESKPNVTSFVEDAAGTLWIGTFGDGLNAVDRSTGKIDKYRSKAQGKLKIGDDRIMSLLQDRDGRIWIGTMTNGITRLDPKSGQTRMFRHNPKNPSSLSANGIMTIYEDSAGRIWVGTFGGGISRYEPATGAFTRFAANLSNSAALSSNRVTSFAQDPSGKMWIGTDAGGLNLFDPETESFVQFRHDPSDPRSLAADTVYSLNVDADGTVWVGTRGGLDRVIGDASNPESIEFANVSQADGLTNDVIYGVQIDENGWIWLSTNYGISRYNPESGEIRNLHRKDGLQSEEFNFGAHYRSASGELFFGGHNGFNAFDPADLRANNTSPLIAITGFFNSSDPIKSDLPYDEDNGVEIDWRDDTVSFEFAALDFTAPEMNRYMYKLEGFDKSWVDLGNRRRITYTDLDAGSYLLRVRAANSDGVWNEAGIAVPVSVKAAPWNTWWAYLGYALLCAQLAYLIYASYRNKLRKEEHYSRRLEREVNLRTAKLIDKNKQLKELNHALQESSLSDPLTGLRNRRFVFEEVSRDLDLIRRKVENERDGVDMSDASELVFMMIDMDNFKPINDTYGHAAGDQMLLEFRDVLLGICRRSDFVIRWGGDEFVVIAKQTSPKESEALAERIRSTVANHNFVLGDGQIVRTTCSIGYAAYPLFRAQADNADLDQIINLADNLMYEAKKKRNAWVGMSGPNQAATSSEIDHSAIEPSSMLFRARRAGNLTRHPSADDGKAPNLVKVVG